MPKNKCIHLEALQELKFPKDYACSECKKISGTWVHLRTCQSCGDTLCCDSSPHRHMTAHFHSTGHAVVISAEPGEQWLWCYIDEIISAY